MSAKVRKGGSGMELTDRKKKILRAIVDNYIQTAEPVGSKTIASMPGADVSSATIRNEMADLTEMGYLEQPHTSAGRIPSPAGYRLYIDELMGDYRLSTDETKSLNQAMELKMQEFDKVMSQVGKLVSKMTNLPAYTMARAAEPTVRHFDILNAERGSFILVVLTSTEAVKNKLIKLPLHVSEQDLKLLSAVLNATLTDTPADKITPELVDRITRSAGAAASLVPLVVDFTVHVLQELQQSEVYVTGQMKLLGQPEYHDVEKAQEVLGALDEDTLANLPATVKNNDGPMQILVGPENVARELKDTSVVMTRFDIGDGMQGMIGVVGPTRMDYARVTARLSYFAEGLGRMFGKNEELPPSPHEEPQGGKDES